MKTIFLGLVLLCPTLTFALDNPADSILVKVGKRASVTFFGEKKSDLKTLEQYDWNAIVRDMNAKLGLTSPSEPRQHYVDLLGNSYLQDSSLRKGSSVVKVTEREADQTISKTQVRRGFEQLRANLLLSYGFAGLVNFPRYAAFGGANAGQNVPGAFTPSNYNLFLSRTFAIGIQKYTLFNSFSRTSFGLRWGMKVEWQSYRFDQSKAFIQFGTEQEVRSILADQEQ